MKINKVYIIHFNELTDRKDYLDFEIPNRYGFSNTEYIISTRESDKKILDSTKYKHDSSKWSSELSNVTWKFNTLYGKKYQMVMTK